MLADRGPASEPRSTSTRLLRTVKRFLLLAAFFAVLAGPTHGQDREVRVGAGLDLVMAPPGNAAIDEGFGIGVRSRLAIPLTYEVSLGLGAGLSGSVHQGRSRATYALNPQASLIVTFPQDEDTAWWPYALAGVGGFVPLRRDGDATGGPALHGGIGWSRLLEEASVYVELDPTLVIGQSSSSGIFALRGGVIF